MITQLNPEEFKCSWRQVAEHDLEKKANDDKNITLAAQQECYDCNGYDMTCKAYYVVRRAETKRI